MEILLVSVSCSLICHTALESCTFFETTAIQAPSKRIRIFFNSQIFLRGFKNFHVHTYADPLSVRQLICKAIFGSCENFIANRLQ